MLNNQLDLIDIDSAASRLKDVIIHTPLQYSERLSKIYQANIYIKREDLQRCRSFKVRGAYNRISQLNQSERDNGIVCASAGNHAQGVAYSCALLGINGVIFMPVTTPLQKIDQVKYFGGSYIEVVTTGDSYDQAYLEAQQYALNHQATFVHPFDDYQVMCGQATIAKEIYTELNNQVNLVIMAIGGGGLAAGVSSYFKQHQPSTKLIGIEPEGAPSMSTSLARGHVVTLEQIDTFVDGAAVKKVGDQSFEICKNNLDSTMLVAEGKICSTMIELYQYDGIIAEPAGALSIAALDSLGETIKNKTVVCILSGGNNDILRYPEIMERSLVYKGRKHYFIIEFSQKPGQLRKFLNEALGPHDDIVRFEYMKKTNRESGAALVGIELYDKNDFEPLLARMKNGGIHCKILSNQDLLYNYVI